MLLGYGFGFGFFFGWGGGGGGGGVLRFLKDAKTFDVEHRSNIKPERATANQHDFQMHTFEKNTNCRACKMLLR